MEGYCKARIAELIKAERLRHGESPRDVAYALEIDTRTYERWEAGDTLPQPSNFKALSEHWEVKITDLRPDLDAEQQQLDRIEGQLDRIINALGLDAAQAQDPPPLPAPPPLPPTSESPAKTSRPRKTQGRARQRKSS